MKNGWQTKRLAEVATLQRGFDLPTQDRVAGEFPLVSSSGISDTHHKCAVRGPGVVTGRSGSIGNVFFIEEDFWPLNTVLYVKEFHGNDPRFVFHLLKKFDLQRFASGAGVPTLNRNFVHDELVRGPTLPEQRRIVDILDEAFDGIATANANAEKNLQNARALFEGHLQSVFIQRGKGWIVRKVSEIAKHSLGKMLDKIKNKGEPKAYLRNVNVRWFTAAARDFWTAG
jgi:type I restriction enzyme S subunit